MRRPGGPETIRAATSRIRARREAPWATPLSLDAAMRAAHVAVVGLDRCLNVIFWNAAAGRLFGWSENEVLGRRYPEVSKGRRAMFRRALGEVLRGGTVGGLDVPALGKDGARIDVSVSASPLTDPDGNVLGALAVIDDVTERKRAEKEPSGLREGERGTASRIRAERARERKRIGREIHDDLGQNLHALKMLLSRPDPVAPGRDASPDGRDAAVKDLVASSIRSVRRILSDLGPEQLDGDGLYAAVKRHCELFRRRTGIRCAASVVPRDAVADRKRSTAIFRILQEALTNVSRHSGATKVRVRLEEKAGRTALTVEDDGRGITEADLRKPGSFGLVGMRERVRPWGGSVTLCGAPGMGTTVNVVIPPGRGRLPDDPDLHR